MLCTITFGLPIPFAKEEKDFSSDLIDSAMEVRGGSPTRTMFSNSEKSVENESVITSPASSRYSAMISSGLLLRSSKLSMALAKKNSIR
jgi:hypothetical protein